MTRSNLRRARLAVGLTQARLAEQVGRAQSTISALEAGLRQPSYRTASAIARAIRAAARQAVRRGGRHSDLWTRVRVEDLFHE